MENINPDLQKRDNLKKRKLTQQTEGKLSLDKQAFEFVSATGDILEHEGKKADLLVERLLLSQDKLYERELLVLEQTKKMKDLSSEVKRLQDLLSQKNEATIGVEMMRKEPPKERILEEDNASQKHGLLSQKNETTIGIEMMRKEPLKTNILEEDNASQKQPSQKELIDQSCCRCISNGHGDQVVTDSISDILRTLIESVLGMRVSFGPQSAEVVHEKSGYSFTLTWSRSGDELVYNVSSLGTLDKIALNWMKEEISFNTTMCPKFFERICGIIGRA